ncbi:TniB protein [Streptomyces sp. Ag109_O5-1]|uniref:ATP-binding protein n=1 Tax=Streptomyces sp. Ag109_O5-1 TaxID=1938851 RepID=UPI000FA790A9|nr:ATP-binding protein [Streptomyces sp. Ag109_O5-1]RPE26701.1 TniB protein [Streptomyces sp. Ag109_O5-1]
MKASVELRDKREARLRQQLRDTPMRPLPLFQLTGWTHFVDEEVNPPVLAPGTSPTEDRKTDEQAIAYHRHLRMVPTDAMTHMQKTVVEAVHRNSGSREGLMDHVIDGPAGTGKTCLLRAIGRTAQQEIEVATNGRQPNTIPVVHITTPADPEPRVNWIWEIGSYLGLNPEPKSLTEVLEMRKHQDVTLPVNYVLETAQTRLLLVDDIDRSSPQQLANVLPYFDYLRDKLGISLIFCGTGASHLLHQARILAQDLTRVSAENRVRLAQAGRPADPVSPSPTALLPVTWLHPLPLGPKAEEQEMFRRVLASFEADLSLYRLEENALSKHAATLHQRTGGYFKALTYVISTAAVIAIHSGSENITEKELKAATAQLGPWQPAANQP